MAFDLGRLVSALGRGEEQQPGIEVRRPDDLLVLRLRLRNLELKTDGNGPRLIRQPENAQALLLVDFPPQSFGEEAFMLEEGKGLLPPLPSARVRMSGPSRLAFTMPKDQSELPYTLAGVLAAMRTWPQSLDVGALPDPGPEGSEVTLGRGRLNEVLGSRSARQSIATLSAALEDAGAEGVREAIVGAGERVADRAAGALTGGASRLFAETTMRVMQAELDGLQVRFSALRSGPAHEAGIAALALAAGSSLADLAGRLRPDVDLIHEVPYLPLLLAPHPPADTATALDSPTGSSSLRSRMLAGSTVTTRSRTAAAPSCGTRACAPPTGTKAPTGCPSCGRFGLPTIPRTTSRSSTRRITRVRFV